MNADGLFTHTWQGYGIRRIQGTATGTEDYRMLGYQISPLWNISTKNSDVRRDVSEWEYKGNL